MISVEGTVIQELGFTATLANVQQANASFCTYLLSHKTGVYMMPRGQQQEMEGMKAIMGLTGHRINY